jgi:hypothetical protein
MIVILYFRFWLKIFSRVNISISGFRALVNECPGDQSALSAANVHWAAVWGSPWWEVIRVNLVGRNKM